MERIRVEVERELGAMGDGGAGAGVMPRVVEVWSDVVGSTVARNAWPARISRDGTLHVATDSAAWAFELQHLEREIAGRLAATVGDGAPLQLKFAVGQLPELGPASEERTTPAPSPEQRELAAALTASIDDDELRALVATAVAQSLARAASDRPF
jgi:hypothetical protein